jgi:hypothetical protein
MEGENPSGIELGLRSGFGLPLGNSDSTHAYTPTATGEAPFGPGPADPLNTDIKNVVPVWFDAGYRILPSLYLGTYFAYGFGSVPGNAQSYCSAPGYSCTLNDIGLGIDVRVHPLPANQLDPWVGLGAGLEWLNASWQRPSGVARGSPPLGGLSTGDLALNSQLSGWDLNLQAGLEYRFDAHWAAGPFVMLSLGQFYSFSDRYSDPIEDKALHEWLVFGFRGVLDIRLRPYKAPWQPPE